jgi:hypothetical protein
VLVPSPFLLHLRPTLWTKQWIRVDRPYNEVFYDIVTPSTKSAGGLPTAMYFDPTIYTANRNGSPTDPDHLKVFNRLDCDR